MSEHNDSAYEAIPFIDFRLVDEDELLWVERLDFADRQSLPVRIFHLKHSPT